MLKDYEVIGKGFVTDQGLPLPAGSDLRADPKHGNTRAGLYFGQLKPVTKQAAPTKNKATAAKAVAK